MTKRTAQRIRSAILTARSKDGMHQAAMIYSNGHDNLWLKAYSRSTNAR